MISPLETDCETHFKYHLDGTIHEAQSNDPRSSYTISLLELDDSFPNAQRAATLQPFLDPNLTVEDLESMKKNYLAQRSDGKFNPFYTMIKNLF